MVACEVISFGRVNEERENPKNSFFVFGLMADALKAFFYMVGGVFIFPFVLCRLVFRFV